MGNSKSENGNYSIPIFIFLIILFASENAISTFGMEQKCAELGANCVCSEPFNTNVLVPQGSSWFNPADSTVKECTQVSVYPGSALERNSNDLVGSNDPTAKAALPSGNQINYFVRGPEGHTGIWLVGNGEQATGNRFIKRAAARFYIYHSPNFQFKTEGGCLNSKLTEHTGGSLLDITNGVHMYNFLTWSPSRDCCLTGPGPDNIDLNEWKGKWWRIEIVATNRNGPGFDFKAYAKDVTDNLPERTVVDLQYPTNEWTPSSSLTPPQLFDRFYANLFRDGSCNGWRGISHYMLAGWDTDAGQRIGAAYEVEGGGSNPDTTPPTLSNAQPVGTLPSGTTSTTMSVTSNEKANCKFSTTANVAYSSMTNTFTTTGGTAHSTLLTGLTNGNSYTRYVKCQDTSGNANTIDFVISFSVSLSANPTITLLANPATITSGQSSLISWSSTNANSCSGSNGWSGAKTTSGSQSVSPTQTTTYTLTCTGTSASTAQSVTVTVNTQTTGSPSPGPNDVVIFQDNFESASLSKWDNIDTNRYSLTNNAQHVKSGTYSLEGLITPTNGYGDLTKWFLPGYDEIYVKFDVMFEQGFQNMRDDGYGMHFFAIAGNNINDQWSASGKAGIKPSGTDFFYTGIDPEQSYQNPSLGPYNFYTYFPDMTCTGGCYGNSFQQSSPKVNIPQGLWQEVVIRVKANNPGVKDGLQSLWLDGVKKIDVQNIRWRDSTILRLNQISMYYYMPGAPKTEHIWIDNVVVWTPSGNLQPVFDYSFSNGGAKTVTAGQPTTNTITLTLISGTTQPVSFSSSGFPSGATSLFSPASCSPTCTTTLTINTINSTPSGNYTINVNGIGGGLTRTTNFRLNVNPIITNSCSWDFFPRDLPDRKVTLGDVLVVVGDFGKTSASPGFNPKMDFNNNNQIDLFDVLSVVAHFGGC